MHLVFTYSCNRSLKSSIIFSCFDATVNLLRLRQQQQYFSLHIESRNNFKVNLTHAGFPSAEIFNNRISTLLIIFATLNITCQKSVGGEKKKKGGGGT